MASAEFKALVTEEFQAKKRHDKVAEAAVKAKLDAYQAQCRHASFIVTRAPQDAPKHGITIGDRLRICSACNKLLSTNGHAKPGNGAGNGTVAS